jgi:hypothetical protein
MTGNLQLNSSSSVVFQGTSFNTTLNIVNPSAARTISLPNASGILATTSGTTTITAAGFIPNSNSVPSNGMYLPSATSLGFATDGTQRLLIDAFGKAFFETNTGLSGGGFVVREGSTSLNSALEITNTNVAGVRASTIESVTGDLSTGYLPLTFRASTHTFQASGSTTRATISSSGLSVVGPTTASSFIASGSTVPTNGMYLPSGNTLGFAANSINQLTVNAAGRVTILNGNAIGGGGLLIQDGETASDSLIFLANIGASNGNLLYSTNAFDESYEPMIYRAERHDFQISNSTVRARINESGELLVGYTTDNGDYKLQVNSQIFATSATIATSDGRYKENVASLDDCLDLVKSLRPVSFTWKKQKDIRRVNEKGENELVREAHNFPSGTQVGFIAQEVQEVLKDKPWLNSIIKENKRAEVKDENGNQLASEEQFYGIAEGNLIAVLTNALQETIAKVELLEAKLATMEAKGEA